MPRATSLLNGSSALKLFCPDVSALFYIFAAVEQILLLESSPDLAEAAEED